MWSLDRRGNRISPGRASPPAALTLSLSKRPRPPGVRSRFVPRCAHAEPVEASAPTRLRGITLRRPDVTASFQDCGPSPRTLAAPRLQPLDDPRPAAAHALVSGLVLRPEPAVLHPHQ